MPIINTIADNYKRKGIRGVIDLFRRKLFDTPQVIRNIDWYKPFFVDKSGIEIGGPSSIFSLEVPVYKMVAALDGCNFSDQTVWEGSIQEGDNYHYWKEKKGYQFIHEASNLESIPDNTYEFLISSHCLEHCANALKTFEEWLRVIQPGGAILLVLPDKRFTFDHKRPTTSFEHLLSDYEQDVTEEDMTHMEEILSLHDASMDPLSGTPEQFRKRSLDNFHNRCFHHHVFDFDLLKAIYTYFNVQVIDTSFAKPYHQIILGVKA